MDRAAAAHVGETVLPSVGVTIITRREGTVELETITSDKAPKVRGPYAQAIAAGELIYLGGQVPQDPVTREIVPGDIRAQTRRVLTNLDAVLRAAGSDFAHVVKVSVFLTDMSEFKAMDEVYEEFFATHGAARSTVAVVALPRAGAKILMDCVAVRR